MTADAFAVEDRGGCWCVCVYECVSVVLRDKMRIGLSLDADLATFKLPDRVDVAAEIEVL